MNRRTMFRILIVFLIGISLYISSTMTRPVGAGGQDLADSAALNQRRVGEVPALAKADNFREFMAPNESIRMLLSFQVMHEAELQKLMQDLYDPASPMFHKWLSADEFGHRFGRSDEEFN